VAGVSMNSSLQKRSQLAAIAWLRWRLFSNSLRNIRGKMELVSRGIVSLSFTLVGLGGATGIAIGSYYCVFAGKPEMLALLLWPVFVFWQGFPIIATAFTNNPDSSELLHFPLSYRSYFLVRLAYGSFDPASALGSAWSLAILLGVGIARPTLLPWTALVLLVFAAFNILFMQMIFAWVERWLAQRRTREIMGVLFALLLLSFQLIGPLTERFGKKSRPELRHLVEALQPVQGILPPGLAADAIAQPAKSQLLPGFASLLLLTAFALLIGYLLHVRLVAQYRGESLSEVGARSVYESDQQLRLGWNFPGFSQSVAAVFEKEVRYLSRSAPMLLTLIMPVFILALFRFGPMNPARHTGQFLMRAPNMAFPAAAAYALLVLTNLVYNSFGGDAAGIQFFYASPARFSDVVLAKNLTHACVLAMETVLSWIAVTLLYGPPAFAVVMASLAGLLFAAPVNFTAGNLLSIYSPKKLDYATFGRQRASQTTILMSLVVQIVVVGIGVSVFVTAHHHGSFWIAATIFLVLAAITCSGYVLVLRCLDGIALDRRETLLAELCRA
jgi:ABC-2 type transport system permease protein